MIRALIVSLPAALWSSVVAQAAPQTQNPVTWEGEVFFNSVSAACGAQGWTQYDAFTSVYRPKFSSSAYIHNGSAEGLSLTTHRGAVLIESAATSGGLGGGKAIPITGTSIGSRADLSKWTTASTAALTISPTGIGPTTASVTISGTITNFNGLSGCTIGLAGAYVQRQN